MQIPMKEVSKLRLYNVYYLCKNLIKIFAENRIETKMANREYYINNWDEYKTALESLRQIQMFVEIVDDLYETIPVFVREKNRPEIDHEIKNKFIYKNNMIVDKMNTIIDLYESMNLKDSKNGIDVKIPECNDLKDYIWYLKEIDFILTQCPYLLCNEEQIQFANVDVGSNWLSFLIEISAGTTVACYILNNIAKLLDKAMILKSHYLSIKQQEEEALKMAHEKTELADSIIEIFNRLKKHYINEVVSQLEEEIKPLKDGEERGKVEKSLEKLTTLLDKGVEIYASLDTPKDIQVLFPEIGETKKLPDSILNFLEDKNEQDEEE